MKISLLLVLFLMTFNSKSQNFDFSYETDSIKQAKIISNIAKDLLAQYENDNLISYFDNRFRIEIAASKYQNALKSLNQLNKLKAQNKNKKEQSKFLNVSGIQYKTYLQSKIQAQKNNTSFKENYKYFFDKLYSKVDDQFQERVAEVFTQNPEKIEKELIQYIASLKGKKSISLDEAIKLCRLQSSIITYRTITPFSKPYFKNLLNDYIIEDDIVITTRDGAQLSATLIRQTKLTVPLPTIFVFNIYAGDIDRKIARKAAKNGYVGLVVNTRGKKNSPQDIEPFEHDANDAYDILDWISKQSWSNGKVGMYGGSYLGFSQWASVKHKHPALKTIVPQVAVGIGIDYPMSNNVFSHYMLQWIHYVENNKTTDLKAFQNHYKWNALFKEWYEKGLAFRDLDKLDKRPSKTFQKWIDHPSYDAFWQNMTPQKVEFSHLNIPILSITGYFDVDQRGSLYYFNEHYKYNSNANHYLIIGPYNHSGGQGHIGNNVNGYNIDPVAKIDISTLVYQWFDYVLKEGEKPKLLKNKVNYQVMGGNKWEHVSSLNEMHNDEITFFLDSTPNDKGYNLSRAEPSKSNYIKQEIDFKDRTDYFSLYWNSSVPVISSRYSKNIGISYLSEPFSSEFELNGSFNGQINLEINKKEKISFNNTFLTSTVISKGSQLLLVVSVNKNPMQQLNYGTGKDVSDETIADAEIPLEIKWYNDSFISIPIKN